tara:strand:- start:4718 stop:5269 length:552 start_codon:yes stop_codon:yes gene_type:complete
MKKIILILAVIFLIGCGNEIGTTTTTVKDTQEVTKMKLTSSAFEEGGDIPQEYTCQGADTNPPLEISEVPGEAKSLALVMDDPDAVKPAGHVWDHWVVWNIPVSTTNIAQGTEPSGVQGITSSKKLGYGGPCPPDGKHKYIFKLYALDRELDLAEGSTKAELEEAMQGHIIEEVRLTGDYIKS